MKVVCIKDGQWHSTDEPAKKYPSYGEVYTVVDSEKDGDATFYIFAELAPDEAFYSRRFIPISDISETEMERNYNFKTEPV